MHMDDKQRLRDKLSKLEDAARQARNGTEMYSEVRGAFDMIASLAKTIREEIVK